MWMSICPPSATRIDWQPLMMTTMKTTRRECPPSQRPTSAFHPKKMTPKEFIELKDLKVLNKEAVQWEATHKVKMANLNYCKSKRVNRKELQDRVFLKCPAGLGRVWKKELTMLMLTECRWTRRSEGSRGQAVSISHPVSSLSWNRIGESRAKNRSPVTNPSIPIMMNITMRFQESQPTVENYHHPQRRCCHCMSNRLC